jgi:hypothetical protein
MKYFWFLVYCECAYYSHRCRSFDVDSLGVMVVGVCGGDGGGLRVVEMFVVVEGIKFALSLFFVVFHFALPPFFFLARIVYHLTKGG